MTKRGMGADASPWKLGDASRVSCFRAAYSSGKDFSRMSCSALVTFSSRPACSTCAGLRLVSTHSKSHPSLALMQQHRERLGVASQRQPFEGKSCMRLSLSRDVWAAVCTVLHMGQRLEWSMQRAKQARQKVWPQGVVTGSYSSFMHRLQSVSSHCATLLHACSHLNTC